MPILFADKRTRYVAALHCGRKGLEKGIIKNLIEIFDKKGSYREDIIVAIGPSISKNNYFIDRKTLTEFLKHTTNKETNFIKNIKYKFNSNTFNFLKNQDSIKLDLNKYAYMQLTGENISNKHIEISNLCTFDSENFFSWRRTKTSSRQWNFICS